MIEVVIPHPPSVNHYWRMVRGRILISREGRAFRKRVCSVLAAAGVRSLSGPVMIHVEIHPPDRRRRDLDNILKGTLDALEHGGAYEDDSQIVRLVAEKREPVPGGRAVVRIGAARQ